MSILGRIKLQWPRLVQLTVGLNSAYYCAHIDWRRLATFPHSNYQSLFFFPEHPWDVNFELLQILVVAGISLLSLGFMGRQIGAFVFLATMYFVGYRYNFGFIHWHDASIAISVFILAMMPLSLSSKEIEIETFAWQAFWGRWFFVFTLFSAGVSKLRNTGWDWGAATNMLNTFEFNLSHTEFTVTELNRALIDLVISSDLALEAIGYSTHALELLSPLILFPSRFRHWFLFGLVIMMLGFKLVFGHGFINYYWPLLLYFVPLKHNLGRLRF